MVPDIEWAIIR